MNDFPLGVSIGIIIVLSFTIYFIIYILRLDYMEDNVRIQNKKNKKDY